MGTLHHTSPVLRNADQYVSFPQYQSYSPPEYKFTPPPKHEPQVHLPQQQLTSAEMDAEAQEMIGWVIDNNSLTLMKIIGTGSFAAVFLAQEQQNPDARYAVKCLFKRGLDPLQLALQRQEAHMLATLRDCPNIVHLYNVIETSEHLFLVLEYCELDLYEAITQQGGFPEDVVKEVFSQLCDAIIACHQKSIYHRDLKPENVLISIDFRIKLADFGLACHEEWSREFGCGSVRYMAPECLSDPSTLSYQTRSLGYSTVANDCWSLGVILINLLFGKNPWHQAATSDPIFGAYIGKNPNILLQQFGLSKEFDCILHKVFNVDRKARCSVQELKMMVEQCRNFVQVADMEEDSDTDIESHVCNQVVPNNDADSIKSPDWSVEDIYHSRSSIIISPIVASDLCTDLDYTTRDSIDSAEVVVSPQVMPIPPPPNTNVTRNENDEIEITETKSKCYPSSAQSVDSRTDVGSYSENNARVLGNKNSFWSEKTAVGNDEKYGSLKKVVDVEESDDNIDSNISSYSAVDSDDEDYVNVYSKKTQTDIDCINNDSFDESEIFSNPVTLAGDSVHVLSPACSRPSTPLPKSTRSLPQTPSFKFAKIFDTPKKRHQTKSKSKLSNLSSKEDSDKESKTAKSLFSIIASTLKAWTYSKSSKSDFTKFKRSPFQSPRSSMETYDETSSRSGGSNMSSMFVKMEEGRAHEKKRKGIKMTPPVIGLGMAGVVTTWMYGVVGGSRRRKRDMA